MVRRSLIIKTILFVILTMPLFNANAADLTLGNANTQVYFSPNGGCTEAIVREIDNATLEVLVQGYSFTSSRIAKALMTARKRAANVEVMLDKSQRKEKYSSAISLTNARIPTYIDSAHAIAHNKVIIIDKEIVVTGSFDFTKSAEEKNAENVVIIRSKDLASIYIDNWQKHKKHSKLYRSRH